MIPIRVLHIITRLDQGGSAENTLHSVADLRDKGFDTFLLYGSTHDPAGWTAEFLKKNVIPCRMITSLVRQIAPLRDMRTFVEIYLFLRKNRFDIVHTHSSKAGILGRWAAWFARVPLIIHTPHGHVLYGYYGTAMSFLFRVMEQVTAYITTRIICLTDGERRDYERYRIAGSAKCTVIHSGVDMERFLNARGDPGEIKQTLVQDCSGPVVGTVTRLEPVKGNEFLIRAWHTVAARYPDSCLLIVGDGSLRSHLERLTQDLGITGSVRFLGLRKDLPEVFSIMDVFVLPSLNEGMGKVLVQAAAMGKPTVASAVCGIPDIVTHMDTGVLAKPADPSALAEAILFFLDHPGEAHTMGNRARAFVTGIVEGYPRFSMKAMIAKLQKLYHELMTIPGNGR